MAQQRSPSTNLSYIIWFALLGSQIIYLLVPFLLEQESKEIEPAIVGILASVGVLIPLVGIFGVPHIIPDREDSKEPPLARSIIQWACCEVASVMGFVLVILGAKPMMQYSLAAIGLLSLMYLSPFLQKRS